MKEDDNVQRPSDAVIALADFIDAVYGPAFEGREYFQELHAAVMREVYPHMRRDQPPPLRYLPTCSACNVRGSQTDDRTPADCEPCKGTGLNLNHAQSAPLVAALRAAYREGWEDRHAHDPVHIEDVAGRVRGRFPNQELD